jgi:integrase
VRGHVQKKSGRYLLVLELDHELEPETGERVRHRVGAGSFRTRREADDALRDALERSRHGWRGPSRLTVADYLRWEWLPGVDIERAATTAALYRTIVEAYLIPRIGGMRLDALSPAVLTSLYADLLRSGARGGKPLAPKSVRHVHTTLRKALADAVEARHIAYNPAQSAKAPKVAPTKDPTAWTAQELARFLAQVAGDRLEALWVLAASSGMRRGELLGGRWTDVDLEAGELKVRQTLVAYGSLRVLKEPKTAASRRTIPLDPRAAAALKLHRKAQAAEKLAAGPAYEDKGLVFADEIGDPLAPESISAAFKRHVREAGLPKLTIHGLRHTYATLGLEAGVDVLYVAGLLGHSSPAITMGIYQHVRRDRLTQAANRIGAEIFGAVST